jgi:uncharacterized protein
MFQARVQERSIPGAVATVGVNERVAFLRRTYAHLAGAIIAFVAVSALLQTSGFAYKFASWMVGGGTVNMLIVFGLFIGSGFITDRLARSETSAGLQYLGLALGIGAFAIFLSPMLLVARMYVDDPYIIHKAALFTLLIFGGLTATVFITRKDFSFLRGILMVGTLAAFGIIVVSLIFGFHLGTIFSVAMIVLMGGYILYETSLLMAYFRPTQHVAASLMLFSTIATLFLYVLRLLMALRE